MTRILFVCAFLAGCVSVGGMAWLFWGSDQLALGITLVIGVVFALGVLELIQFQAASKGLHASLQNVPSLDSDRGEPHLVLSSWIETLPSSLKHAVHARIEGESHGLPAPVMTPYLVGLLVMLGLLGTFVGMVDTLQGSVVALQGSTDLAAIREGLAAPIRGLGGAFGTSVAGVAASAMLGFMSALSRRERILVARELDAKVSTSLRQFSLNYNRQETYKALQAQARSFPELTHTLAELAQNLQQMGQQLGQDLNTKQAHFHQAVSDNYKELAQSVKASLNAVVSQSGERIAQQMHPLVEQFFTQSTELLKAQTTQVNTELLNANQQYLAQVSSELKQLEAASADAWQHGIASQQALNEQLQEALQTKLTDYLAQIQSHNHQQVEQQASHQKTAFEQWSQLLTSSQTGAQSQLDAILKQQTKAADQVSSTLTNLNELVSVQEQRYLQQMNTFNDQQVQWQTQHAQTSQGLIEQITAQLTQLREQEQARAEKTFTQMEALETSVARHLSDLGQSLEAPMQGLIATASEAPKAAAEVIRRLQEEMTQNMARDNDLMEERRRIMSDLDRLAESIAQSTLEQGKAMESLVNASGDRLAEIAQRFDSKVDSELGTLSEIAQTIATSSLDVASTSEAFAAGIQQFSQSNDALMLQLNEIQQALSESTKRSDEQLGYYVAQAREIIDHSMLSQKGLIEELAQLTRKRIQEQTQKHADKVGA